MSDVLNLPERSTTASFAAAEEESGATAGAHVARNLQMLLEQIPEAIACYDRGWRLIYANPEALRAGRMSREDLRTTTFWQLYPEAIGTPLEEACRSVMETRVAARIEHFSAPFDAWADVAVYPIDDGVALHYRDVTERKKNEEALAASEARYRVLADLNPQAIWMGAADGQITYANQGFLDYIGLTIDTIGGLGWLNAFYERDREHVLKAWTRSVLSGFEYDTEARIVRARDGAVRWWWLRALPVRDEIGGILHWLGVGTDIHDKKTAAEALRQRQQQTERQRAELETVYQTAPVGLALFDPVEFRYLRLNERQAEILGMSSEQILGRTFDEIAPLPGLLEIFRLAAAGHAAKNQIVEGELAARPGEHRVWNVSYTPVYAEDGSIQAITAAWMEITHLKKAESALVQSEKLAAVGRLASSISHEINNPLEAITNLLYLIALHEELPQELKIYVHMAQSELARVSQIATQTLRFHRQAVKPTWVTAGDLIDAVLNLYQGRLANSGIKVHASYSTRTRVLCFENDIRQVLNNLIANAIDAMRTGGRLITRAHDATDFTTGRTGVRLTIADTGHGMSKAVLARLFEPFYTTKALNGTGLGLWISEGIVQRHRGRLSVRSSQGQESHGTVFSLFLPCEEEPSAEGLSI
jgi:PAS domain S-box-containing protein